MTRLTAHEELFAYLEIKPLLQQLLPRGAAAGLSPFALLSYLLECEVPEAKALPPRIHAAMLRAAVSAGQHLRHDPDYDWRSNPALAHLPADLPSAWHFDRPFLEDLEQAARLERDCAFLRATAPDLTGPLQVLETERLQHLESLSRRPARWAPFSAADLWAGFQVPTSATLPPGAALDARADCEARLAELATIAAEVPAGREGSEALRRLVTWPDSTSASHLLRACVTPRARAYASHALALRTGATYSLWSEWAGWLQRAEAEVIQSRITAARLSDEYRDELRLIWLRDQPGTPDPAVVSALAAAISENAVRTMSPLSFARRREILLTPADVRRMYGGAPVSNASAASSSTQQVVSPPPIPVPPPLPGTTKLTPAAPPVLPLHAVTPSPPPPQALPAVEPVSIEPTPPPDPPAPTVWSEHLRPLLAANWYIVAGLLMVVAGASLLGTFTWDKSALVRYLLVPVLLAGFTSGMAEIGSRLMRRHEDLRATGTFLLGGAICLLPVNFMVLGRAGGDVSSPALLLGAFGLYAVLAGLGLWRWCGAVHGGLQTLLGIPLLAINLLAVIGDMPGVRDVVSDHRALLVPASFTAAVFLALAVSDRFLRLVLTRGLLEAKTVPWFFGITMAATTVQVALWRHFHLSLSPEPRDYALAAILAGAALLRWERRAGELRCNGAAYSGESFLGYAALLLGILMAAGHEWLRITTLLLSGAIWLVQAPRRPGVVHHWIGATLCLLGGAAFGLLDGFPKSAELNLLPALGLALALVAGATRVLSARLGETRLQQVAVEIQPPILLVSAIVAVLSQYHLHSAPWQAGLVLLIAAAFFAVRATMESRRDWLNIAAACAALALPYLGGADMMYYRFHDNALALGFAALAIAWLTAARVVPGGLWRESASVLVIGFGAAGILGLAVRLVLALRPALAATDLAGGVLLAGALGYVAWHSRSPAPGFMAAAILAALLPLFHVPAAAVPGWLHVGSGATSAAVALALMLGCFELRRRAAAGPQAPSATRAADDHSPFAVFIIPVLAATFWLAGKALVLQVQPHITPAPFAVSAFLVAATLYAAALYFHRHRAGNLLFHASWPLLGAGFAMVCDAAGCRGLSMVQFPLLWTGIALTLLLAAEHEASRTRPWVTAFLVRPRLGVLAWGAMIVAGLLAITIQIPETDQRAGLHWLALFVAAQLAWHGLRSSPRHFGMMLYLLTVSWLCHWRTLPATPGQLPAFLLAVLAADLVLEFLARPRALLEPVRAPFIAGATALATILAIAAFATLPLVDGGSIDFAWSRPQLLIVIAAMLLAARTQACAGLALPALAIGYLLCLLPCDTEELFRPWRMAALALVLCILPFAGRALLARWPRLLRGLSPQLPAATTQPQAAWLLLPGLLIALGATCTQVMVFAAGWADDSRWVQIVTVFAAVVTYSLAGFYWRHGAPWAIAACLLPATNLFAIAALWGRELIDARLTSLHIVGLAAVLTIAEFAAIRWALVRARTASAGRAAAALWLHRGGAALAGLTLVLIGVNYLISPDLEQIPVLRLITSGLLALAAGIYFRLAARRHENLMTQEGVAMESLWHVGLGLALWCGALSLPGLRTPHAALYALALPAVACWFAAEWFLAARGRTEERSLLGVRFRVSAGAFAALVLALYILRLPFQLLLFPNAPLGLDHYHTGAAAAVVMGFVFIRLRGLGAPAWSALTGGLALIAGLYFLVSWLPGLSPFHRPMAGAWTAVAAAHLLIVLSFQQSPLRSLIQHISGIGADEWHADRRIWGVFLTLAAHAAVVAGVARDYSAHSLETTPLLVALASVLIHQAMIGAPWARAYWTLAALEVLVALHIDFILPAGSPGLIPARSVVWLMLIPWLGAAFSWRRIQGRVPVAAMWAGAGGLAVLCAGHLLYHRPETGSGLLIFAGIILAALATPTPEGPTPVARVFAGLLLTAPPWLAAFGTRWLTGDGSEEFRPLLAASTALLGLGMVVRMIGGMTLPFTPRRLAHDVLDLCRKQDELAARTTLGLAFVGLGVLTFLHADARAGVLGLSLALSLTWAVSCVAWFREGRWRDGWIPYTLCVLSLVGAWILLRRLLFQNFNFWTYEYDLWLSLGASIAFSAAKRLIRHEHPGMNQTMTGVVWLLPVLQCVFLLVTRMSADLTLIVIGVQAMLFAWQGGGRRDSAYNAVAMLGFVGFVCLLFWAKLDLRHLQAYTIPCGLGVLGLVWLFGQHMPPALRSAVRLIAIATMLGSCGYYALLDNSYPVAFHVTMLVLSLAVMALGPILRVQHYLYLGFAGFATDLVALVVKQFQALDRSIQMMGVGALLLLLGIAVVGGAILYKTHREQLVTRLARVRTRLGTWE